MHINNIYSQRKFRYPSMRGMFVPRRRVLTVVLILTVFHWTLTSMGSSSEGDATVGRSVTSRHSDLAPAGTRTMTRQQEPDPKSLVPCPPEGSPYRLACLQSFGFFQTIHQDDWNMEQERARKAVQHPDQTRERGWYNPKPSGVEPTWLERLQPSYWFMDHYQPVFTCPHVRRVGGLADGGKWVCDVYRLRELVKARRLQNGNPDEKCLIYSIGSNGNFDFEDGLIEALGGSDICEIHVFDFDNWDSPELRAKNIFFHPWGLTSEASHGNSDGGWKQNHMIRKVELLSFQETRQRLGHEGRAIDIFKIDCESCEWKSYKDWLYEGDVRQILIETHGFPPKPMKPTELFDDFHNNNFIMYSKEPNMIGRMMGALEWGFIRLHPDFLHGELDTTVTS